MEISISQTTAVSISIGYGLLFVGSLYIWPQTYHRDHPETIKRRFTSILGVSIISTMITVWVLPLGWSNSSIWTLIGVRFESIIIASILPLVLTSIIFIGPLTMDVLDETFEAPWQYFDIIKLRNLIVGPAAEEWVFRGCMIPLLAASGMSSLSICLTSPAIFGIAHLHHAFNGPPRSVLARIIGFIAQFIITGLFGMFSSFIFLRTGHVIAPFLSHAFCNWMGPPQFHLINSSSSPKLIWIATFAGAIGFYFALFPFSDPSLYQTPYSSLFE